jgi:hypothetical protein
MSRTRQAIRHRRLTPAGLPDRFRVELSLDPRPGRGHRLQRLRIDDLVGRSPDLSEGLDVPGLVGEVIIVPVDHHFVQPSPEEVCATGPLELVDECVHLLVGLGPVEFAVLSSM